MWRCLLKREMVRVAILGAGTPVSFLGASQSRCPEGQALASHDEKRAEANIAPIETPLLILAGTADSLIDVDRMLHNAMEKAGI